MTTRELQDRLNLDLDLLDEGHYDGVDVDEAIDLDEWNDEIARADASGVDPCLACSHVEAGVCEWCVVELRRREVSGSA